MRSLWLIVCVSILVQSAQAQFNNGNRRFINAGNPRRPNRPNPAQNQDEATRLGLLANQVGIPAVPGGTIGSPEGGFFQHIPGGEASLSRDDGCWCQPINQVCTLLGPENLNLVTRILNRPGSPGTPGQQVTGCNPDQRFCCHPRVNPSSVPVAPAVSGALAAPGTCGVRRPFPITGVSPTADYGEYPWMAVIMGEGFSYVAGGVLISPIYVMTAAHKLQQTRGPLTVRLGDYDVGDPNDVAHFESPVANTIIHPNFNARTLSNDVALLRLARPVPFQNYPNISPACLPGQGQLFDGQRCFVSGWGRDAFAQGSHQRLLQEVDVPIVESFRCEAMLRETRLGSGFNLDRNSFLCAGGEQDKDACQGDGGSPLVCHNSNRGWIVAGMVAWGVGCGNANVPAAYVNVASYRNFISSVIGF